MWKFTVGIFLIFIIFTVPSWKHLETPRQCIITIQVGLESLFNYSSALEGRLQAGQLEIVSFFLWSKHIIRRSFCRFVVFWLLTINTITANEAPKVFNSLDKNKARDRKRGWGLDIIIRHSVFLVTCRWSRLGFVYPETFNSCKFKNHLVLWDKYYSISWFPWLDFKF